MKRLALLLFFLVLSVTMISLVSGVSAQPSIPNLQGTWDCSLSVTDQKWDGSKEVTNMKKNGYISQSSYEPYQPNLFMPSDGSTEGEGPFEGLVQGNIFFFSKIYQKDDLIIGREIITGTVNKSLNSISGNGMGFYYNPDLDTWSYKMKCKKLSNNVP